MTNITFGTASIVINNEIGTDIQAATCLKKVKSIRDNLEANALWLKAGKTGLLFISCDLVGLDIGYVNKILPDIADACGINEKQIILGTTHNHSGPAILGPSSPDKPLDIRYLNRLKKWLCNVGKKAVQSTEKGELAWGVGYAQIGYNRRCCWADGSHSMHGDTTRKDFIGLEGEDDPQQTAIFIRDSEKKIRAVLFNNTTHPTTFYGRDFLSADWPGLTRQYLRSLFGDIAVLYFNGTSGDIAQDSQLATDNKNMDPDVKIARNAHLTSGENLRILHQAEFKKDIVIKHKTAHLKIPLRSLTPENLTWAKQMIDNYKKDRKLNIHVATAWQMLLLHKNFHGQKTEKITIHAASIDGLAFVTAPCELFTHFGKCIKARSPFEKTAVFGHSHGFMGYCPTTEAVIGGGWGGDPTWSVRWEEKTGYRLVDETVKLLCQIH